MRLYLLVLVMLVAFAATVSGQEASTDVSGATVDRSSESQGVVERNVPVDVAPPDASTVATEKDDSDGNKQDTSNAWYKPPTQKVRLKSYVNGVIGPVALVKYAATAGLTTARNTPSEWGPGWEGYGRRFANTLGKSAIRRTTMYALDETLKIDSKFYPSRDRKPVARLRNAIFSPFTARNREGERVAGIPRIAGSIAAGVIASEVWYPKRFNYVHGLKGAAIALAFNATFNIFREFIWKNR